MFSRKIAAVTALAGALMASQAVAMTEPFGEVKSYYSNASYTLGPEVPGLSAIHIAQVRRNAAEMPIHDVMPRNRNAPNALGFDAPMRPKANPFRN